MQDLSNISNYKVVCDHIPMNDDCNFLQGLLVERKRLQVNCAQYACDKCHGQMKRTQFPISRPSKCVNFSFSLEVI
jgi:hypothetical protein